MSDINIYMNAEDKVIVKDDTQIIKLQGPKGEPFRYSDFTPEQLEALKGPKGDRGENGEQGPKGEPFRYSDFSAEQLEALKGPKGDKGEDGLQGPKGEPFKYTDFTAEQLATLKGEKGDKGETPEIPNTVRLLKEGLVYLPSEDLDTVLTTVLNKINASSTFMYSYEDIKSKYPFTVDTVNDGEENITVHGYDHFKVQVENETPVEILDNKAIVPIPKNTGDFINVKYINFLGEVVESKNVEKVKEDNTPAVIYQENNPNMKLSVKGTKAFLEFIKGGRTSLRDTTLKPLKNTVKRLIIDLVNVDNINDYVTLPFVPEKIQIINYKPNSLLNLSFQGDYYGTVKILSEKPIAYHDLNSDGEYEVSSLNGKGFTFGDNIIYVDNAL